MRAATKTRAFAARSLEQHAARIRLCGWLRAHPERAPGQPAAAADEPPLIVGTWDGEPLAYQDCPDDSRHFPDVARDALLNP
jgi:hypothetical protein